MDQTLIIIVVLLFSAFFSGCEMAFISSNKLLIELNKKRHPKLSRIIDVFFNNSSLFISMLLIGNNIALVIYGLEMGRVLEPLIEQYLFIHNSTLLLLLQTLVSTLIILITAEFMPKVIFRINPILVLNVAAVPLIILYIIFYPLSRLTAFCSEALMKRMTHAQVALSADNDELGRVDLDNLLAEHQDKNLSTQDSIAEINLLKNALDFNKVKVRECIIPRTDIKAVDMNESIETLQQSFSNSGHSKILIYKESIDNIIGYVHISQLFKKPEELKNIISSLSIVPESMSANMLLAMFTKQHRSIALVVDEFGGTAGIVTMEDILEEIFGEIDDEHDVSDIIERRVGDDEFIFSGKIEIDYINEKYKLNIPQSDNYETLAGYILNYHESIPKNDEIILINDMEFQIQLALNNRIDLVHIKTDV